MLKFYIENFENHTKIFFKQVKIFLCNWKSVSKISLSNYLPHFYDVTWGFLRLCPVTISILVVEKKKIKKWCCIML